MERLFDAIWNEYWVDKAAYGNGKWDEAIRYRWIGDHVGFPQLNNLVFPMYAWLYLKTGDERHRERAEKLFNGSVKAEALSWEAAGGAKAFHQLIRWTFDGLKWYQAGQL
jgi:hypothetical protein